MSARGSYIQWLLIYLPIENGQRLSLLKGKGVGWVGVAPGNEKLLLTISGCVLKSDIRVFPVVLPVPWFYLFDSGNCSVGLSTTHLCTVVSRLTEGERD